jgi:glycosyltransferase involved in cell wall biosynthesis
VAGKKKVLDVMPYAYLPYRSGGQKSIAQFLEYLGHEVDLSVITVPGNEEKLKSSYRLFPILTGGASRYYNFGLIKKISRFVKENGIETIIWEHPYYAWLAIAVRKRTGVKTIFHTHNIEYLRFKSLGKWWWRILKLYERWAFKKADAIFFIAPEERECCIQEWKLNPSKCFNVPFGVPIKNYPADKAECRAALCSLHNISQEEKILLFNGALDYAPNTDAVRYITEHINPLLLQKDFRYKIIICGKSLPASFNSLSAYANKNIIYTGFVDDIELYFKGGDIFLNPVQTGGGIKTKMVEAIAFGTTVVATASGAAGIVKEVCGEKLQVVADGDWEGFAEAIVKIRETKTLTPAGYYANYYWGAIAENIVPVL